MTATQPALFTPAAPPRPEPPAYDRRPGPADLGYIRNAIKAARARAEYRGLARVAVVDDDRTGYGFRFQECADADAWPVAPGLERELLAYLVDAGMVAFGAGDVARALEAGR